MDVSKMSREEFTDWWWTQEQKRYKYCKFCEVNGKFMIVKTDPKSDMKLNYVGMEGDIPVYERIPWQYHLWNKARFSHIYRTDVDTNAREDQNWLKKIYLEYPNSFYNIDKILHYYYYIEYI